MVGAHAASGTGRPTLCSTELGGDRRLFGLPEQLELVHLIGHGPKEDPLDTGMREGREILREHLGRADQQALSGASGIDHVKLPVHDLARGPRTVWRTSMVRMRSTS